jgi:hypothetical protein
MDGQSIGLVLQSTSSNAQEHFFEKGDVVVFADDDTVVELPDDTLIVTDSAVLAVFGEPETEGEAELLVELRGEDGDDE